MDKETILAKSLESYIREKHTQEECIGFIDGFKKALESTEPKEEIKDKNRIVYWFDKRKLYVNRKDSGKLYQRGWPNGNEDFSPSYDTAEERDKAREEWIKSLEKKPLFTLEGHQYFDGDKCYWFSKKNYKILTDVAQNMIRSNIDENSCSSKIYPTSEACESALKDYVYFNHQLTLEECNKLTRDEQSTWLDLAERIIESKKCD